MGKFLRISALLWVTPALLAAPILIRRLLQQCFASLVQNKEIYFSFATALSTRVLLVCNTQRLEVGVRKVGIWWQKYHRKLDGKGAGGEEGQGPLHSLLSSESIAAPSARETALTQKRLYTE